MTLVEHNEHHLVFTLSDEQRLLLEHTLKRYPVDFEEEAISRFGDEEQFAEETEMLREAVEESRAVNRRAVGNFLREPGRFVDDDEGGCRLLLQRTKINWLLEVLNEIRVGYWHLLGRPNLEEYRADAAPDVTDKVFAMQLCGWFQMSLLEALEEAEEGNA
jgi:hypothetical protein